MKPRLSLSAPSQIGRCGKVTLDYSGSSGNGGRKWYSSSIRITGPTKISMSTNLLRLQSQMGRHSWNDTIDVSYDEFPNSPGKYSFILTRCNFLRSCSSIQHSIFRHPGNDTIVPTIGIYGNSKISIKRNKTLELQAYAYVSSCESSSQTSVSNITFEWSVSYNGTLQNNVISTASDSATFRLKPFSLKKSTYEISAFAVWRQREFSEVSISVTVIQGKINVIIENGKFLSARVGDILVIDASGTYDEDDPLNTNSSLVFEWSCFSLEESQSSCTNNGSLYVSSSNSSIFSIRANQVGTYIFEVLVTLRDNVYRFNTASVMLEVKSPLYPCVYFPLSNKYSFDPSQRLLLQAITTVSTFTEYYWLSSPSLGNNSLDTPRKKLLHLQYPLKLAIPLRLGYAVLYEATIYSFTLSVSHIIHHQKFTSTAVIDVLVNTPPKLGSFQISPTSGLELMDEFSCLLSGWQDDDLPLQYDFSYHDAENRTFILQSKSPKHSGTFIFPALGNCGSMFRVHGRVFDYFNFSSSIIRGVTLLPLTSLPMQEKSVLLENTSLPENSIMSSNGIASLIKSVAKSQISYTKEENTLSSMEAIHRMSNANVYLSSLNVVDCATLNTHEFCAEINRQNCTYTPMTCGPCQPNYVGEVGGHNTPCYSLQDYNGNINKLNEKLL